MEITVYRDDSGFESLKDEWNALLGRSLSDTIFLTQEWQSTWWRELGSSRGPLFLLACRLYGDHLVGILPLYLSGGPGAQTLSVVGCVEVSDYLDLIVERGCEEEVYSAFLDWLEGPDAPDWNCVELCNQPEATLTRTLLPHLAKARGWQVEGGHEDVCPIVTLPQVEAENDVEAAWNAYLETLDKKQRHEVRRKLRRVEREVPGARVRFVTSVENLEQEVNRFVDMHKASTDDKDAFMSPDMQRFFRAIAGRAAEAGWLQLSFLDIGDESVASMFCFDYGGDILLYNSGYDPAAYPQLSTGWVLLAHVIREAIRLGRARIDFLQGDEDYKYRFGGVDSPVYHTVLRHP